MAPNLDSDYSDAYAVPTSTQWNAALAGLSGLHIAADYNDLTADRGGCDRAEFDNIVLRTADPPGTLPVPATAVLIALALGALALRRSAEIR